MHDQPMKPQEEIGEHYNHPQGLVGLTPRGVKMPQTAGEFAYMMDLADAALVQQAKDIKLRDNMINKLRQGLDKTHKRTDAYRAECRVMLRRNSTQRDTILSLRTTVSVLEEEKAQTKKDITLLFVSWGKLEVELKRAGFKV